MEATGGFEPPNRGFADLRLSPLGYVASNCAGNWVPDPGPIMVPRAGLEPTRAYAHGPLKTACLPIPPPRPVDACRIIPYLPGATRFFPVCVRMGLTQKERSVMPVQERWPATILVPASGVLVVLLRNWIQYGFGNRGVAAGRPAATPGCARGQGPLARMLLSETDATC